MNNGNAGKASGKWCLGPSTGGASAGIRGIKRGKILRLYVQNLAHCGPQYVLEHCNNENAVSMRSGSFSTIGTAFPHIPPRNDPRCHPLLYTLLLLVIRTAITTLCKHACFHEYRSTQSSPVQIR